MSFISVFSQFLSPSQKICEIFSGKHLPIFRFDCAFIITRKHPKKSLVQAWGAGPGRRRQDRRLLALLMMWSILPRSASSRRYYKKSSRCCPAALKDTMVSCPIGSQRFHPIPALFQAGISRSVPFPRLRYIWQGNTEQYQNKPQHAEKSKALMQNNHTEH
jgi:hypothetical protein